MTDPFSPGRGALPPRAWQRTSAPSLSLDGPWAFRLAGLAAGARDFDEPAFADAAWDELPVPAFWQLNGYGAPAYTNIDYPFPIDPPRVPDANPTGEYRREFELADGFPLERAVLRFEGVDSLLRGVGERGAARRRQGQPPAHRVRRRGRGAARPRT